MNCRIASLSRILVVAAVVLLAAAPVRADVGIAKIREKADRFYQHEEWGNALAMFRAILDREPTDVATYGRAVTVNGVIGDTGEQLGLLEATQRYALPLDSLFEQVRISAFETNHPEQLENFMVLVKTRQPWLKRNINLRLARYYNSRNNAEKMIEMSDSLLAVNPDDPSMLRIKARGFMLLDRYEVAMPIWERVVELDATDVDAMLNIGVYYASEVEQRQLALQSDEAEKARRYLKMAAALQPTDRVAQLLEKLTHRQ